jgi:flagellar hook assembly protein FlgD
MYYSAIPKEDMLTGIKHDNNMISDESVSQNYPNPFNGVTTIKVNLTKGANLSLTVSNILGQEVMNIQRGSVSAGTHYFELDGTNLNNGVYFYTVKADDSSVTKKMVVR